MELLRLPAVLQARADALPGRVRLPRGRGAAPRLDPDRAEPAALGVPGGRAAGRPPLHRGRQRIPAGKECYPVILTVRVLESNPLNALMVPRFCPAEMDAIRGLNHH